MTDRQLAAGERGRAHLIVRATMEAVNLGAGEHTWLLFLGQLGLLSSDKYGQPSWSFTQIGHHLQLTRSQTFDLDSVFQRQRDLGSIHVDSDTGRESWAV